MVVGIDLDNIVVNTTETVLNYLAERGAPKLTLEDIKDYWLEKSFPPEYSLLVKEAFESKYMWKQVRLIDGAYLYIKKLYEDGHEIWFVTSSLPENLDKKIKHLTRNLDFFPEGYIWRHTINIHKKQMLKLDFLIDDCYDNLIGPRDYWSICYKYPWNYEDCDKDNRMNMDFEGVIYVNNWEEIYRLIDFLKCFNMEDGQ